MGDDQIESEENSLEGLTDDQDKRGEIPLEVQVFAEDTIKGMMEPERIALKSSLTGTGVKALEQPRLSCREATNVGGCGHADGSLERGGSYLFKLLLR